MTRWLGALCLLLVVACKRPSHEKPRPLPEPSTPMPAAAPGPEPAPPAPPAAVESLLVPGDLAASVVRGADGKPPLTMFVAGVCSIAGAYLHTFPRAAQKQGGVIAIEGDQRCAPDFDARFRTYSWDANRLHQRIEAALAAAGTDAIPKEGITLVGYSQGASLAEQLAAKYPGRYSRVVIIASPKDPQPRSFAQTRSLVTMACSRDVTVRMKTAAAAVNKLGTPAFYAQMPDCTHGQVADGENVFGQTFDFLARSQRAVPEDARSIRITGPADL